MCQQKGGYDLVGLVPHYRMVRFGNHLTESERAGVDKLLIDNCRVYIEKSDYFRTTLSLTNGGEFENFSICLPWCEETVDGCPVLEVFVKLYGL